MKATVLGAGLIGRMMVKELAKYPEVKTVVVVDSIEANVKECMAGAGEGKVDGKVVSLKDAEAIAGVLAGSSVALAALPNHLSMSACKAAIKAKCHLIDLVGLEYPEKYALNDAAREAGVLIVPGLGLEPGIANILAGRGVELLDEVDEVKVLCGGLPRHPAPPLWYQIVFRLESVFGLYTDPANVIINGKLTSVPALSDLEPCTFPGPVGECEAAITDPCSLAYTLQGKVASFSEKTVRYKGHFAKIKTLDELGFLDEEAVDVDGAKVSPRSLSMVLLESRMRGHSREDVSVLRVLVSGKRGGKGARLQWDLLDMYDHERQITSMAKTTGFPALIAAKWLLEGKLPATGVVTPEELLIGDRFDPYIKDLADRGIDIAYRED